MLFVKQFHLSIVVNTTTKSVTSLNISFKRQNANKFYRLTHKTKQKQKKEEEEENTKQFIYVCKLEGEIFKCANNEGWEDEGN